MEIAVVRPGWRRALRWTRPVIAVALISATLASSRSFVATASPAVPTVTITRDSAVFPHIVSPDFTSLGYGEAWAFAHDNFCTLAQDFVTVNGERSRYFGPQGLILNYSAGAEDTNLASDLYWQSIKATGVATSTLQDPPPVGPLPQVRQIYEGYVAEFSPTWLRVSSMIPRVPVRPGSARSP